VIRDYVSTEITISRFRRYAAYRHAVTSHGPFTSFRDPSSTSPDLHGRISGKHVQSTHLPCIPTEIGLGETRNCQEEPVPYAWVSFEANANLPEIFTKFDFAQFNDPPVCGFQIDDLEMSIPHSIKSLIVFDNIDRQITAPQIHNEFSNRAKILWAEQYL
jgi:hypothetical protein